MAYVSTSQDELLRGLKEQLRWRNAAETLPFKDVFESHQSLVTINEKLREQTVDQDKVIHWQQSCEIPFPLSYNEN